MKTSRPTILLAALAVASLSACGGSGSSQPPAPTIQPARTFELAGFEPAGPVTPGMPTTLAFTIRQPDGRPLSIFRRGAGPHTGVHLIIVRDDLVDDHPPPSADRAERADPARRIIFPAPGTYRVVVDVYPKLTGPLRNFQLFRPIRVAGTAHRQPLPPFRPTVDVDGYRVRRCTVTRRYGRSRRRFLTVTVTGPNGKPARFTPWYGALAHAIFFRQGSLDYFHTHVCAPGASGCTSLLGGASVTGTSSTPGKLTVGVLVPVAGIWRLFLQTKVNGRVLTAPFTLRVR